MFPDLRLLISATVATFFLAATAGLYASLRINQDQIAALADARIIEDAPVTRIANGWPTPEPSRAAALRDLIRIATYPPIVAREEIVTDRSGVDVPQDATQSTMPETQSHAALKETPAQDVTGSTGIATKQEPASAQSDRSTGHPRQYRRGRHGRECESPRREKRPDGEKESAAGDGDEKGAGGPAPPQARAAAAAARRSAALRLPLIFDGPGHQLNSLFVAQSCDCAPRGGECRRPRCTDDHAAAVHSRSFACDDGHAARAGFAQQPRSRASRRCARLHALLGRRAPQSVEHRELRARHHDRADRGRDIKNAYWLRRGDAAQSRAADRHGTLQGAGSAVSRTHRSRPRTRARHRPDHVGRIAAAAGYPRRRRFPRAPAGNAADREQRLSRQPSVFARACDAHRRRLAAALPPGVERLQRQARGLDRGRIFLRASFCQPRRGRRDADLSRQFPAIGAVAEALRHSGGGGGLRRKRERGRTHGRDRRSQYRAARAKAIICRSKVPRRRWPFPTHRSIATAWRRTANGCLSARPTM